MPASATKEHPAQFSEPILHVFEELIPPGVHIHDPNAGPGVRLGLLANRLGCTFSGTEIEPEFIVDPRVIHGDATVKQSYPKRRRFWVVTSPAYPSGMADSWVMKDGSVRRTYRYALKKILGSDRELHDNNQGRWGYRGTGMRSIKRKRYWEIARGMVECWTNNTRCEGVILNVSDFKWRGNVEPVVMGWDALMIERGWVCTGGRDVVTRRYKNGSDESRDERMPVERILVYRRG